jgi:hypothetical protein
MNNLPADFNWKNYLILNVDLKFTTEEECKKHYVNHGVVENRVYIFNIPEDFNWKTYLDLNPDLLEKCSDKYTAINHYIKYGKNENRRYFVNLKDRFREICFDNINYMRNIDLPDFKIKSIYESVLIEYRCMPHLEFIIRNTIIKLGEDWCHTIICGNLNYSYIYDVCSRISSKIDIIKTNYDNLLPHDYSKF